MDILVIGLIIYLIFEVLLYKYMVRKDKKKNYILQQILTILVLAAFLLTPLDFRYGFLVAYIIQAVFAVYATTSEKTTVK